MSNSELNTKWNSCLEFIQDNVEPMVYETWFTILKPVSLENNTLLIEAPSSFVCEFIKIIYLYTCSVSFGIFDVVQRHSCYNTAF